MEIGELVILALETMLVSLCMKIISVLITVILYGRMIEIYLYSSVGAIPFATMSNRNGDRLETTICGDYLHWHFRDFSRWFVWESTQSLWQISRCQITYIPHCLV